VKEKLPDVPSVHRKRSSIGCSSEARGAIFVDVHRQVQDFFQSESSWFISENKGEIGWQLAK
jgi:hypothetical protein